MKAEEGFITAVAPGSFARRQNQYYKSDEEFLHALAEALREEYKAIVDAGLVLQLDDPGLPDTWDMANPEPNVDEYKKFAMVRVEALNHGSRPSSWWRFAAEAEAPRVGDPGGKSSAVGAPQRSKGARSMTWRIVLRPQRRYQALRHWRTAARLRGLTATPRPSVGHQCRRRPGPSLAVQGCPPRYAAHGICRGSVAPGAATSPAIASTCM